jgi:hypothetical protein
MLTPKERPGPALLENPTLKYPEMGDLAASRSVLHCHEEARPSRARVTRCCLVDAKV